MASIQKPQTQKEMVEQMWFALVGTNGEGVFSRVKRVEEVLSEHISACVDPVDVEELKEEHAQHVAWHLKNRIGWIISGFSLLVAAGSLATLIIFSL